MSSLNLPKKLKMNTTPQILILGGKAEQLHQLSPLIPPTFSTIFFPAKHQLFPDDVSSTPQLILVIQEGSDGKALKSLRTFRENYCDTPILFFAKNPDKKDIIKAFRVGASDYLMFPIEPEEFSQALKKYIPQKGKPQSPAQVKKQGTHSRKILRFKTDKPVSKMSFPEVENLEDFQCADVTSFSKEPHPVAYDLSVHFFGKFAIWVKGKMLELLPGEKNNALLAYLLYLKDTAIHRESLLSRFWGSTSPSSARNSLNVAMHSLRRYLHTALPNKVFFQYRDDKYIINPRLEIATDTDSFKAYWQKGRSLEVQYGLEQAIASYQQASSFYKDDFLKDIHYEEWCDLERENLLESYLFILHRLGFYYLKKGAFEVAIDTFKKMMKKDICLEDVHRKLIFCYYKLGLRDIAIKQYYKCAGILKKELKVEPSHSTKELFNFISAEKTVSLKDWENDNLKLY